MSEDGGKQDGIYPLPGQSNRCYLHNSGYLLLPKRPQRGRQRIGTATPLSSPNTGSCPPRSPIPLEFPLSVQNGYPSPQMEAEEPCGKSSSAAREHHEGFPAVGMASGVVLDTGSTANPETATLPPQRNSGSRLREI